MPRDVATNFSGHAFLNEGQKFSAGGRSNGAWQVILVEGLRSQIRLTPFFQMNFIIFSHRS